MGGVESFVAWILALAIAAGAVWLVWWTGRRCLHRWRNGVLSRGRIALEILAVLLGVLVLAWGAAIAP